MQKTLRSSYTIFESWISFDPGLADKRDLKAGRDLEARIAVV